MAATDMKANELKNLELEKLQEAAHTPKTSDTTKAELPGASADKAEPKPDFPAAGPHARAELNDAWKTPGAGMLAEPGDDTMAPGG